MLSKNKQDYAHLRLPIPLGNTLWISIPLLESLTHLLKWNHLITYSFCHQQCQLLFRTIVYNLVALTCVGSPWIPNLHGLWLRKAALLWLHKIVGLIFFIFPFYRLHCRVVLFTTSLCYVWRGKVSRKLIPTWKQWLITIERECYVF